MIVHFSAPSPSYSKSLDVINRVKNTITELGHTLTGDASADTSTMVEMGLGILDQEEWELMYQRNMRQLARADLAIFEVSDKATFGIGYLAAHALMVGKSTLFLMREGSVQGSFTSGLKHEKLARETYNEHNLSDILITFLSREVK